MAKEPQRKFWESIRLWIAAVAIPVVLAVAGFWQFYLKEVLWPATAINLTTELTVEQAGYSATSSGQNKKLEAIELVITARNPSSSTVYLLANYWVAWGLTVATSAEGEEDGAGWLQGVADLINDRNPLVLSKHSIANEPPLIAVGTAFQDSYLRANEKVTATFVFYVPQDAYDVVEVLVSLPTASKGNPARHGEAALGVEHALRSDFAGFDISSIYRIMPDGTREVLPTGEDGAIDSDLARHYGFQSASSRVQLPLWPSKPPSPAAAELQETPPP